MFFQLFAPKARRATLVAAAILIGGFAATAAVRAFTEHMLVTETQRRFTADAADITTAIGERLRTHAEVLVSMQGLYASLGRVDRAQFRRYLDVLDVSRRYPGFQALQSLRNVKAEDLEAFVAEMRADPGAARDGQGEFAVRPPGARPSYNAIEFVEPMRGNEDSLGFDAGSNPAQLDSLRRAAETGRIVATPPVKLVQDNSGGLGFILRAPIYRAGEPAQTTTQRVAALRGFVASVYRMNDLMRGVLDPRTLQQMHVTVIDRGYAKPTADGVMSAEPEVIDAAILMYDSFEPNLSLVAPAAASALGISADRALVVGDRVWRVTFDARVGSSYAIDRALPNFALVSGVIITLLIALLTAIVMRSRQLSGSLSALDAEQRALVDNPLAGILFTDGRRILRGNRRIAELTGREADTLPGSTIDQLLAGEADRAAFATALARVGQSGLATEVELHLRRHDGAMLPINAYGKPLARGEILWVVQDKTDALLMEAERREHAREMQATNARLTASLEAAEIRAREIALLTELSGMLQSCQSLDEIYAAIETYAVHLFPDEAGALYLMNAERDAVQRGARWGALSSEATAFGPLDCWALRRGAVFPTSPASQGMTCRHACCAKAGAAVVCQPLIAQNNLLGLLYREHASAPAFDAGADQLATMLAEQVSLAIANLELREQLRGQATRDALTGLHNRRHLEDALTRETARSAADGKPLALALLDVDHFKKINDTHGHDGGDAVLRGLGEVLRETARGDEIVGRFGGEEFLLLLPGASVEAAEARAGAVLDAVRAMQVSWPGGMLAGVTASIGIAVMPFHAAKAEALVAAADAALYRAKAQGRNRVVVADKRAVTVPVEADFRSTGTDG
jgi:diguanylate cyclase (GGDEF)-like protein/PAS domain S-box-containing protein